MSVQTQFSVFLINRPGVLAAVMDALTRAEINISAFSLADSGEHGVLRVVTENPDRTRDVLNEEHDRFTETDVLAIALPNRPGAFAEIARRLAEQHVNIAYAYASGPTGAHDHTVAILKPADMNKARQILGV